MLHDYGCKENGSFQGSKKGMILIGLLCRVHQSRPEVTFNTRIFVLARTRPDPSSAPALATHTRRRDLP